MLTLTQTTFSCDNHPLQTFFFGGGGSGWRHRAEPQDSSLLLFSLTSVPRWVSSGPPRARSYQAPVQLQEETGCSPHSASEAPFPTVLLGLQAPPRHTPQGTTPNKISKVPPTDFHRQWPSVGQSYKLTARVGQVPALWLSELG